MTNYDVLLGEAKMKFKNFQQTTAHTYIPRMYEALRNENSNTTAEDARDRIEKDCLGIWSKRTILDALPDEAKDLKKQKAGRSRQKEANSAATNAAPANRNKVIIDTEGKAIENRLPTFEESFAKDFSLMKSQ